MNRREFNTLIGGAAARRSLEGLEAVQPRRAPRA
jgi:hypothetical protein